MFNPKMPARLLDPHMAVASRLVRSAYVPREFFVWLAEPTTLETPPERFTHAPLTQALAAIITPVSVDASRREKAQTETAPQWLASIGNFIADCTKTQKLSFGHQLLATSLLPMYRTLATGNLLEGFAVTQHRLAESLVLIGLNYELGNEFSELLDTKLTSNQAPWSVLREEFALDLVRIRHSVLKIAITYLAPTHNDEAAAEGRGNIFPEDTCAWLWEACADSTVTEAEWATPELLWRLAGEMTANKSEMVLPRPWIDTPVPWSRIADHWSRLSHQFTTTKSPQRASGNSVKEPEVALDCLSSEASAEATLARIAAAVDREVGERLGQTAAAGNAPRFAPAGDIDVDADFDLDDPFVLSENSSNAPAVAFDSMPKVMMAEIRSHNDPLFINVIRRRLATCRSEERTLCLSHIVVACDEQLTPSQVCDVRDNGMTLWQQKLVNWLAEHPHISDPYAFLTSDGELILCVLDLERNEMTAVLRQGLFEVLTGKRFDDEPDESLAKVQVPARFHAGIATTSSPGANLTAEQLIEPAIRCLTAAQRQGKASIKSIEVF